MKPSSDNVRIRLAGPADASGIVLVLRESFLEYQELYTPEGFAATTLDEERVRHRMTEGPAWKARLGDAIVGTASAVRKGGGSLYIRGMAVLPSARGQRVGESLLREVEGFALREGCTRLSLSTTPFLGNAIRLYERFGFERTNDGPNELFGTPLFTMCKILNGKTNSEELSGKEHPCRKTTDTPPAFA